MRDTDRLTDSNFGLTGISGRLCQWPGTCVPVPGLETEYLLKKATLVVATALLVLFMSTACGGSSDKLSKADQKVADTLSSTLQKDSSGTLTKKQADCFSTGMVTKIGVAGLKKAKMIDSKGVPSTTGPSKLTADVAGKYADSYLGCVDFWKLQVDAMVKSNPALDGTKLLPCLKSAVKDSDVKKLLVGQVTQTTDAALTQAISASVTKCETSATTATPSPSPSPSPSKKATKK
jgi:hypothetical protein